MPRAAQSAIRQGSQAITVPVTTLAELCAAARAAQRSISSRSTSKAPSTTCCSTATGSATGRRWWWSRRSRPTRWRRPGRPGSRFCAQHGYRYVLVRQPQPLLPRRGGGRAGAPVSTPRRPPSTTPPIPQRQAGAAPTRRIPTIDWRPPGRRRHDAPAAARARPPVRAAHRRSRRRRARNARRRGSPSHAPSSGCSGPIAAVIEREARRLPRRRPRPARRSTPRSSTATHSAPPAVAFPRAMPGKVRGLGANALACPVMPHSL